jgi:hypothetical protein
MVLKQNRGYAKTPTAKGRFTRVTCVRKGPSNFFLIFIPHPPSLIYPFPIFISFRSLSRIPFPPFSSYNRKNISRATYYVISKFFATHIRSTSKICLIVAALFKIEHFVI